MIRFENVSKKFKDQFAIRDISFSIEEGEKFVLLGTSGSGKSTVLKHINFLLEASSGEIFIKDEPIKTLDRIELRRNTGYIIQDVGLFPHYTVEKNIALVPHLKGTSLATIKPRISSLLDSLKLDNSVLSKYPDELSGGQRQRVGIARALAGNPPLLLLDEPLSALDPITKIHIQDDFIGLKELRSTTMVWVTHDIKEAFKVGTKICLLDEGVVQQIGTARDFLLNPKNKFVRSFFANDRLNHLMHTLTLADIADTTPEESSQAMRNTPIFSGNTALLQLFEMHNPPHTLLVDLGLEQTKHLSTDQLFRALVSLSTTD